ncbi:MAG TPA: HAMP domain-containing sensor histidine kinase [Myxococcaceae bacterium]
MIEEELAYGVPLFLDRLVLALRRETPRTAASHQEMGVEAARHGRDMLRQGFTVAQLVHDYGAVCQAITQLVAEQGTVISAEDYSALNGFLDDAIAEAVTGYGLQREQILSEEELGRLGFFAHELRNLISTALLAYQAVKSGRVGINGNTGDALGRSLKSLRNLVDRSLSEVRLTSGIKQRERVLLAELIEDIEASAVIDAQERGLQLTVVPAEYGLAVEVDRQLLDSAVANLLQNAFKFTRPGGNVCLRTHTRQGSVVIEVEDECGGLPPGKAEGLFQPFEQRGNDRSGLGLGLAISLQGVRANGGEISVRNFPGTGCIFTIELPLAAAPGAA